MARFRLSAHSTRRLNHRLVRQVGSRLPSGTSPLQGTHRPVQAPTTERKRRLKRFLHHCLREMSRTRGVEVYSAITKLDSFAPYFVQSRTLDRRAYTPTLNPLKLQASNLTVPSLPGWALA